MTSLGVLECNYIYAQLINLFSATARAHLDTHNSERDISAYFVRSFISMRNFISTVIIV